MGNMEKKIIMESDERLRLDTMRVFQDFENISIPKSLRGN
jgi:hypothetical protein